MSGNQLAELLAKEASDALEPLFGLSRASVRTCSPSGRRARR